MSASFEELNIPIIPGKEDDVDVPARLPVLPLRKLVLFPGMVIPLAVGRPGSVKLVDEIAAGNRLLGAVSQKNPEDESPGPDDLYTVGTVARIAKLVRQDEQQRTVLVQGIKRFRVKKWLSFEPYPLAEVESLAEAYERTKEIEALNLNLKRLATRIIELTPHLPQEVAGAIHSIEDSGILIDFVAGALTTDFQKKQEILETLEIKERFEKINSILSHQVEVMELRDKIQTQVKGSLDKTQREYVLREQLKAIKKELGEADERESEIQDFRKKIKEAEMPEEAEKEANSELDRMSAMPPAAPEYSVIRTYLQWLSELPWAKSTEDKLDIKEVQKVLDEDHYDLEKVKERIVEYLAVRKLKPDMKGPILCFAGPPGVGKTSLGKSIARALGRKFVRNSLGGVHDEAEIRGHRRTYIGALPGRIIQGIKKAGSNNPVFMLDEVDKIGADFRGDPSSALLEVLDPEQNYSFSDHSLGVPFALSSVMFITTANILDTIPAPLRDRMEVIELPGYIPEEKLEIAKTHLIPRQMEQHGIPGDKLSFKDEAVLEIISSYTMEAGVRNLEREIASICRKVARKLAEGGRKKATVYRKNIPDYLGQVKFFSEIADRTSRPGVATGLSWTPVGGQIMFVEATKMPGKGQLILTGQLGDVMKESAQAALSYIRAKSEDFKLPEKFSSSSDTHIHVPAGAIRKDGPSAGITICTALASLFLEKPVRSDIALTGEITLRGLVLPIGGVKEKLIAAYRAGIKKVIMPEKNRKDLEDVPDYVRKKLEFAFVHTIDEAVDEAINTKKASRKKNATRKTAAKKG